MCVCVRECVRKIIITVGHGPSVENIHSDHAVPLPPTPNSTDCVSPPLRFAVYAYAFQYGGHF